MGQWGGGPEGALPLKKEEGWGLWWEDRQLDSMTELKKRKMRTIIDDLVGLN